MIKLLASIFIVLLLSCSAQGAWQDVLNANFEITETFDNIDDWSPTVAPNGRTAIQLPTESGGSPSKFQEWDYWATATPENTPWIADHGTNSWRGKSLRMDVPYVNDPSTEAKSGPSRIAMFFGSGTSDARDPYSTSGIVTSGFRGDVYIFYMLQYPPTGFEENGSGGYEYIDYYKHHVLSTGYTSINTVQGGSTSYGASNIHTGFSTGTSYGNNVHFLLRYYTDANWTGVADPDLYHADDYNINAYVSSTAWFGIEIHVHRGTPGGADGYQEAWVYDANGTPHSMGTTSTYSMMPSDRDWGFTKFFIGGNSTIDFTGHDSIFYVDDLIINSGRIGPTYFALLAAYTPTSPVVTAPAISITSASSSPTTSYTLTGTVTAPTDETVSGITVGGTPVGCADGACDELSEAFEYAETLLEGTTNFSIGATASGGGTASMTHSVTYPPPTGGGRMLRPQDGERVPVLQSATPITIAQ